MSHTVQGENVDGILVPTGKVILFEGGPVIQNNSGTLEIRNTTNTDAAPINTSAIILGSTTFVQTSWPQATWFMPNPNFAGNSGTLSVLGAFLGVNEVQVWQFLLPYTITVNKLTFETVAPDIGNNIGVAIYNAAGTTKLIDTGAISATTGGIKSVTIAGVILTPGVYWLAWTHDSNAVTVRGIGNAAGFNPFFNDVNVKVGTAANSGAAGVCPTTLGVVTAQNIGQILIKLET
jgi:hypothetical protein